MSEPATIASNGVYVPSRRGDPSRSAGQKRETHRITPPKMKLCGSEDVPPHATCREDRARRRTAHDLLQMHNRSSTSNGLLSRLESFDTYQHRPRAGSLQRDISDDGQGRRSSGTRSEMYSCSEVAERQFERLHSTVVLYQAVPRYCHHSTCTPSKLEVRYTCLCL